VSNNLLYNDFIVNIYIYNWIGNKFLQLASPSPYKYSNSINKTNQLYQHDRTSLFNYFNNIVPISIEYILFGCNEISEELNTLMLKSVQFDKLVDLIINHPQP
jgi:hypothetical protein